MLATRTLTLSILYVGLSAVLTAQAPALDIKFGLWENTIVTNMGGAPPIDTSKMTPEQAAKVAAAMQGMMGDRTMTQQSCVKKEDLEKDSFMLPQEKSLSCKRTITTNTRSAFAAEITCTGEREMKGQINIESLAGGTAFKGAMKMVTTAQGRSMNVNMTMAGKYLSADCGTVK
jgi:hypothetical protein